ncbi:MoxR family ATPase [Rivularia sp. UHCC 0363]|uniref:AAA family ATPase n=1 Tax=Rivularia sp. UHCC 0363 TaxID=3110244 RepID=UPI002B21124D|nr:MoxR family ATPase [Rivularia sp. UHCC 0363]MEA5597284.1 MoxR family ATPase [Rivularia sp. UHCC 0363]
MNQINPVINNLAQALNKVVVGQSTLINQLLIALLAGGHIILEGVPGTGKTLLVKVMAQLIQADFRRIQLTPDVLPSDITGTNIFDLNTRSFSLKKGPIFTQVLLADEINRTPPKTQAALLEGMEELQVTLDGESLPLPELFWAIATQNPLEFEGTYPLPEAQLDRFLFKLVVDYPDQASEKQMLLNRQAGFSARRTDIASIKPVARVEEIIELREAVKQVKVTEAIIDYLLALVRTSRQNPDLALGASPRAANAWFVTSQAAAYLAGRDFVTPDDVKAIALPLLRHRFILKPEAMLDGLEMDAVISSILNKVPVPR